MGVLVFFSQVVLRIGVVDGNEKLSPWVYQNWRAPDR